jgi:hypothetical protein
MTIKEITNLQKDHGYLELQEMINTGIAWKLEGSIGREAMAALESGACYLPTQTHKDYYGNVIPDRNLLEDGTKGTLLNSKRFWESTCILT